MDPVSARERAAQIHGFKEFTGDLRFIVRIPVHLCRLAFGPIHGLPAQRDRSSLPIKPVHASPYGAISDAETLKPRILHRKDILGRVVLPGGDVLPSEPGGTTLAPIPNDTLNENAEE